MIHHHTITFKNAFRGLKWAFSTQPNFKIHITLGFLSLFFGIILQISSVEFVILLFLIFVGLAIETVNTAIEQTTDAIDTKWRKDIGLAKDISAGAMLIFAIGAVVIACFIFIPRIIEVIM